MLKKDEKVKKEKFSMQKNISTNINTTKFVNTVMEVISLNSPNVKRSMSPEDKTSKMQQNNAVEIDEFDNIAISLKLIRTISTSFNCATTSSFGGKKPGGAAPTDKLCGKPEPGCAALTDKFESGCAAL
ncbi:unnamed protein product, partial [Brugia pahangi]|uniref:Uncharacterized protein n=1 Tax=Brugia pahangi TaxID=6280 RepID=A0A0N4TE20_BRUPA